MCAARSAVNALLGDTVRRLRAPEPADATTARPRHRSRSAPGPRTGLSLMAIVVSRPAPVRAPFRKSGASLLVWKICCVLSWPLAGLTQPRVARSLNRLLPARTGDEQATRKGAVGRFLAGDPDDDSSSQAAGSGLRPGGGAHRWAPANPISRQPSSIGFEDNGRRIIWPRSRGFFYVGMTRARQGLTLWVPCWNGRSQPSRFLPPDSAWCRTRSHVPTGVGSARPRDARHPFRRRVG